MIFGESEPVRRYTHSVPKRERQGEKGEERPSLSVSCILSISGERLAKVLAHHADAPAILSEHLTVC